LTEVPAGKHFSLPPRLATTVCLGHDGGLLRTLADELSPDSMTSAVEAAVQKRTSGCAKWWNIFSCN